MPNRIRELRTAKGMNQTELAEELEISQGAMSNWETGRSEPDFRGLRRLSEIFGVSVDYIMGRTEERNAIPQEAAREVLAGDGVRILLDADANLTDDQLSEIVEFIKFKRRTENR